MLTKEEQSAIRDLAGGAGSVDLQYAALGDFDPSKRVTAPAPSRFGQPRAFGQQDTSTAENFSAQSEQGQVASVIHRAMKGQGGGNADAALRQYVRSETGGGIEPADKDALAYGAFFCSIQDEIFSARQEGHDVPSHVNFDRSSAAGNQSWSTGDRDPMPDEAQEGESESVILQRELEAAMAAGDAARERRLRIVQHDRHMAILDLKNKMMNPTKACADLVAENRANGY
jgi:hypothetical protein